MARHTDKEIKMATHNTSVTLDQAQAIIEAARAKADDIGVPMNIAVVDAGNNLTAFSRMDGAWLGSIDIAQSKAYTARAFDMPTRDLAKMAQPGKPLFGIEGASQSVIIFAGGIPLTDDETVVGAVGVSGGTPDQDHDVCAAAVAAYG
jgi:uncharacterized protein GlcG (DUF336 family)